MKIINFDSEDAHRRKKRRAERFRADETSDCENVSDSKRSETERSKTDTTLFVCHSRLSFDRGSSKLLNFKSARLFI